MPNLSNTSVAVFLFAFVAFSSAELFAKPIERPNVVVILTDDQGWGDLSLHGNPNLSTPNIDSLARQGAQIEHFYVCPVCSPTRAEFLTGRYHTQLGVYSTSAGGERLDAEATTIGDIFKGAGYATAAYGKWHNGMQYPYHPNARGFDDFYGFCSGHWGHYFSPMLEHNGEVVQGDGFIVDDLTNHAMDFIEDNKDRPFFVYLALNTPHSPMQVPDRYWEKFRDKDIVPDSAPANQKKQSLNHTRAALAMCENIDDNVGRLVKRLDRLNLTENTIVVYFSDNGPNGSRFNGGMRGRKGSTFEGGVRSPCFVRYPAGIEAGTKVKRISGAIDLLPTLAEMSGVKMPDSIDGVSVKDALEGDPGMPQRYLFGAWNGKSTVRTQKYRYHHTGALFDIENDPGETNDVSAAKPKIAAELQRVLNEWQKENPLLRSNEKLDRPITLGHESAKWTQLPARDATATGKIQRSNRYPNCTYMKNWSDTDSQIIWNTEVLAEGTFEVQMYYACDAASVGSMIELTCGESTLKATIEKPNECPLIGAQHDRFQRMEGYVRRWKPMTLGTITITPGRKLTTLRALTVVGTEVAEMRQLVFRRIE